MARGWESKSVEEQQSEFKRQPANNRGVRSAEELQKAARIQALQMQRSRVREQLKDSQNPRFLEILQHELQYLEAQIQKLSGS